MYGSASTTRFGQPPPPTTSEFKPQPALFDLGIAACTDDDRPTLRDVLARLMSNVSLEPRGDVATHLQAVYEYCLIESANGDLTTVRQLLEGLRDAWAGGFNSLRAA